MQGYVGYMRVGDDDARKLAEGFASFEARDLQNLETGQAVCRVERSDYDFNLSIPPAWRSYEDYLGALDAKYRRNAKDQVKKLTAAGCTMETLTNLAPHANRLHELYLAVHQNASVRLVTLPPNFIG